MAYVGKTLILVDNSLLKIATINKSIKAYCTFIVSILKVQYGIPYSYIVTFSYDPIFNISNMINAEGYNKGESPFYYRINGNNIELYLDAVTYSPFAINPLTLSTNYIPVYEVANIDIADLIRL